MKSKIQILVVLSVALVGMACGGGAATGGGAMANYQGRWVGQLSQNGINFSFTLDIGSSSTTYTNVCSYGGNSLTVSVTAASKFEGSTLVALESRKEHKSLNGLNCDVAVTQGQRADLSLSADGRSLTVSSGAESLVFKKQ